MEYITLLMRDREKIEYNEAVKLLEKEDEI